MTDEGKIVSKPLRKATLPAGSLLHDTYVVKEVLGSGGFGVTYLGEHRRLNKLVAIKEYWPDDFATRDGDRIEARAERQSDYAWGLQRFLDEAQTLARFRHQNIVGVSEFFEAHGTAYMVLDYEKGRSLRAWLEGLASPPTQEEVDLLVGPLLDALELLHAAGVLHRDIAPDNIYIRENGTPVLLDFGSAREAISQRSRSVSAIVKAGYSPQEQYTLSGANQGAWTDIYALAATLYEMISGAPPLDAPDRIMDDKYVPAAECAKLPYRAGFLAAIDWALRLMPRDRPQSIKEWRTAFFSDEASIPSVKVPEPMRIVSRDGATRVISKSGGVGDAASSALAAGSGRLASASGTVSKPEPRLDDAASAGGFRLPEKRFPVALVASLALLVPALGASYWGIKTFMKPSDTVTTVDPKTDAKTQAKTDERKTELAPDPKPGKPEKADPKPEVKAEPPRAELAALTRSERLGIARALYDMKAVEDAALDRDFIENGTVRGAVRAAIERFQRMRSYKVTGDLTQEQVTYLVNMQSAPTPWEAEQGIPLMKDKGDAVWQRLRLTLTPDKKGSVSEAELREALKGYQQRKGLSETGYLNADLLGQLLDDSVSFPWPAGDASERFGKWKFSEDASRCRIWTETTHVTGRYLGATAPIVEVTRPKPGNGGGLSISLGEAQFYDTTRPVKLTRRDAGAIPLQFERAAVRPGRGDAATEELTSAMSKEQSFRIAGMSIVGKALSTDYASDGFRDALRRLDEACGAGGEKAATPVARPRFGAASRHDASFFAVWNYTTQEEAREAAKKNCQAQHSDGKCSVISVANDQCFALARDVPDTNNWGYATGDTVEAARELAMSRCKEAASKCKVSLTFCSDGANVFNDR